MALASTVIKKVGKRPKTAHQIAQEVGEPSYRGVSVALRQLVDSGQVVKGEKGYSKAA
jgi:hypothetical protein